MLIIARHGRTEANRSGLLLGRSDPDLDDVGRGQAVAVADAIASEGPIERIVTSPLSRTRSTAAAIADATGARVDVDERWIEVDYGELEATPVGEVPAATWAAWQADLNFTPPGGESLAALGRRVDAALADLVPDATEARVVVVSHVSPIKAAVAWALGVGGDVAWRCFLSPASITRIGLSARGPSLHGFNLTDHLPEP